MGAQTGSHIEVIPGSIDLILLMYHFVIFNIVYAVCVSDVKYKRYEQYERCERCVSDVSGVCMNGVCERYEIVSILMSQNAISSG